MSNIRLSSKEQEELVLKNQRLVYYLLNKLDISPNEYEDMASIGKIGLVKAAATFDASKNIAFATYASRCINNEFFMHFRKEKSHMNDISLDEPIGDDGEGHEITLIDKLPSLDKDFTEQTEKTELFIKCVNIALNLLEPRERLIILYRIAGNTQSEIAKILNLSRSYVSKLETASYKTIKLYLYTIKQFKKFFSMAIIGDSYQISFASKDKQFSKIFATLLQGLDSTESLPDFKINCNKEQIIIQISAYPEAFSFIAMIIQEIDNYSLSFTSNKKISKIADNSSRIDDTNLV